MLPQTMLGVITLVRTNGNLRGLRPKGTYTLLCFIGIFTINMYHGYGFKLLILVTEARTKHS